MKRAIIWNKHLIFISTKLQCLLLLSSLFEIGPCQPWLKLKCLERPVAFFYGWKLGTSQLKIISFSCQGTEAMGVQWPSPMVPRSCGPHIPWERAKHAKLKKLMFNRAKFEKIRLPKTSLPRYGLWTCSAALPTDLEASLQSLSSLKCKLGKSYVTYWKITWKWLQLWNIWLTMYISIIHCKINC